MKKCILLISVLLCAVICCPAQSRKNNTDVRLFEFEIGFGGIMGNRYDGAVANPGLMFFVEPRFNLPGLPIDLSTQACIFGFGRNDNTYVTGRGTLSSFIDYNYRWDRVSLFAGLGVGIASIIYEYPYTGEDSGDTGNATAFSGNFVLTPRIGAEFFNHLRLTLEYRVTTRRFSYAALNLGFAFGGGRKK